jgi:hypothetical protein
MGASIKLSPFVLSGKGDNLSILMGANSKLSPFVKLGIFMLVVNEIRHKKK